MMPARLNDLLAFDDDRRSIRLLCHQTPQITPSSVYLLRVNADLTCGLLGVSCGWTVLRPPSES
jgi:hypothetical protein